MQLLGFLFCFLIYQLFSVFVLFSFFCCYNNYSSLSVADSTYHAVSLYNHMIKDDGTVQSG